MIRDLEQDPAKDGVRGGCTAAELCAGGDRFRCTLYGHAQRPGTTAENARNALLRARRGDKPRKG
eukprot:5435609-Lingulodinium_polyedra.AAC.1